MEPLTWWSKPTLINIRTTALEKRSIIAGHCRRKLTVIGASTSTGRPFSSVGL